MSVVPSGGLRMEIGVLYLSHAMLVLAELLVCSTRGLAYILAKWFGPTVMSLSLTYGSLEASRIKKANTFWKTECKPNERVLDSLNFVYDGFRNSYGRNNPMFEYWSYTLFVDL